MRVLILLLLVSISWVNGEPDFGLPKPAVKKVFKTFEAYFPDKKVDYQLLKLTEAEKNKLSFSFNENTIYKLFEDGNVLGYMCLGKSKSKFDTFNYMVIFNTDLTILTSKVLIYREDYGGEISSKRWLKQFDNKTNGVGMELERDIQIISGATISCRSITLGIKTMSKNIIELNEKGFLI